MHWPVAALGASVVALGVLLVVKETLRARRLNPDGGVQSRKKPLHPEPRIPRALLTQHVARRKVIAAAVISAATIPLSVALGASFPAAWLAFLVPWLPVVATEAKGKLRRDTLFALFGLLVLLQFLHMVEHSVQVGQLVVNDGALAASHGIFGQLDFELVHFVTDSTLWISLGAMVIIFRGRNTWLVVAFIAASLHQVEHNYLFWIDHADNTFYKSGGAAGIMGHFGIIGSPLDRPYLHYTYNFIVTVPMLIALWDEARRVDRDEERKKKAVEPTGPASASPAAGAS
jgi:hypothetical protein